MRKISTKIFKELVIDSSGVPKKVLACSYSQIEVFLQCNYKWYLTYLLGKRIDEKTEALGLGSAVHITLQEYLDATKEGKEWELGEALSLLDINMDIQDIPFLTEENKEKATKEHKKMIDGLVNKSSNLYKLISECDIVACEKDFVYKVALPFSVMYKGERFNEVYIIGSIDLLLKDKNGSLIVIDYKSGTKTFDSHKLKTNLQLPIYSLVVKGIYGRLPVQTMYYFTRFDEFQEVESLAESDDDAKIVYYKNGKVKNKQRSVRDIIDNLKQIFEEMYTTKKFKPNTTPLCCWCVFNKRYGTAGTCPFDMLTYWRKDIDPIR